MTLISNIARKCYYSLILIAGVGLMGSLMACEGAQSFDEGNALAEVTGELTASTDWDAGDLGVSEGSCGYLCNDGRATKIIGACFAGTRCDRSACEREEDGMLIDACVKLPIAVVEQPDAMADLGVEVNAGECGYKCENHELSQVEAFCKGGERCQRVQCTGDDRSFTLSCIEATVQAPTEPVAPILPAEGECDYRCFADAVISFESNCGEGTVCDATACTDAEHPSVSATCVSP